MLVIALLCAAFPGFAMAAAGALPPRIVHIALEHPHGAEHGMVTGVFMPGGDGPFPVVIYSHGRSFDRTETRVPERWGFVRYWVRRGFVVVAPIRPGYGETGGDDREDSGVLFDIFGNCWGQPQFARAASAASEAIAQTIDWVRAQPWADAKRIVLVGTSMGGLASIAGAAENLPGVVAIVNFAGGTGGNGHAGPEHSCGSLAMESLMAQYGARTHVPSLWLYARNDSFWGAERPRAWHRAFAAGGSDTELVTTDPVPNADGHQLLGRGSRLWMPPVDRFLSGLGF